MAEATADKPSSLSEQYFLKEIEEKTEVGAESVEVKEVENSKEPDSEEAASEEAASEEVASEETVEAAREVTEEGTEVSPDAEESAEPTSEASEESEDATAEESNENTDENSGEQEEEEETPEIKLETAPADFRFPTTNQTRHCFTRYVEYHRCVAAKGEGAPECDKFAKYYRSLCPGEWIERWNEQRENGTFPGPL
ncbi:cytochrome c oxidase subunit 6b-1 [Senna tora]|uniref:Cytochrome c oxidase subunit 6b-1 n=1 Tax=Senna tora TaxID=362788 RepID=A0A834WPM2_9FABA|nr:cytochrome c oxidase subunit 6b-1 [Senna tora]